MKILMVLTSHDRLGDTGGKTDFWLEEFAAPYYVFKNAGAEVVVTSPAGGQPPVDPKSEEQSNQKPATGTAKAGRTTRFCIFDGVTLQRHADHPTRITEHAHAKTPVWIYQLPRVGSRTGTWYIEEAG
jgi:putative intracellular protease/amidase